MAEIIGRDYCLRHPRKIIGLFGLQIFIGMLLSRKKSLLQRVTETYERRGIPMPGSVGNAYRISALIEYRMSRLYSKLALRFGDRREIAQFFEALAAEEAEHARLMMLCLYTVKLDANVNFVPGVRDPEVMDILKKIRKAEKKSVNLPLDEALHITEEFEKGEVNTIFDKLLKQTGCLESLVFREKLNLLEGHGESVPRRIAELRERIGQV